MVDNKITLFRPGSRGKGLSEAEMASLRVLKEHSRELVFESRGQALRMLLRARKLDRYTATEHVVSFWARGLIRIEKLKIEDLQPRLFEVPPEPRRGRQAP